MVARKASRTFLFVFASNAGSRLLAPDLVDALSSSSSSSMSDAESSDNGRVKRAGDASRAVTFARMTGPSLGDMGELVLALVMLDVEVDWSESTEVGGEWAMDGERPFGGEL